MHSCKVALGSLLALAVVACGASSGTDPAQSQASYGQQQGNYPQASGYPQQGGYGQQSSAYPQATTGNGQTTQPTTTASTAANPLAFACQSDATCGTHRCNVPTGRCAFPCAAAATDCMAGAGCVSGLCVPGMATSGQ
jgi:hypothetical protein